MYNRQKWEPKKNGNADPEHMNCTHKHNTHRITSEFSTCSKLMRFLSMSSSVPLFCYIKMYYVSLFYRAIFSSSFVLDFFFCHKLLLMIFHSWQHVAAGIIINFHALRAVKRLSVMNSSPFNGTRDENRKKKLRFIRWATNPIWNEENNRKIIEIKHLKVWEDGSKATRHTIHFHV